MGYLRFSLPTGGYVSSLGGGGGEGAASGSPHGTRHPRPGASLTVLEYRTLDIHSPPRVTIASATVDFGASWAKLILLTYMVSSRRGCDSVLRHDCLGVTPSVGELAGLPACLLRLAMQSWRPVLFTSIVPPVPPPDIRREFYEVRDTCAASVHGARGCFARVCPGRWPGRNISKPRRLTAVLSGPDSRWRRSPVTCGWKVGSFTAWRRGSRGSCQQPLASTVPSLALAGRLFGSGALGTEDGNR